MSQRLGQSQPRSRSLLDVRYLALSPRTSEGIRRRLRSVLDIDVVPAAETLPGHVMGVLARQRINCVLDVGANVGEFGKLLRSGGYEGKIVSFEPVPEVFRVLERAAANDASWFVYNVALGEQSSTRTINVSSDSHFSSMLPTNEYGRSRFSGAVVERQAQITQQKLDDIYPSFVSNGDRIYLKTDTQGWDLHVLRGAQELLDRVRALQVEVGFTPIYDGMPTSVDVIDYVTDQGFQLTGIFPVSRDEDLRLTEADYVLVRP